MHHHVCVLARVLLKSNRGNDCLTQIPVHVEVTDNNYL